MSESSASNIGRFTTWTIDGAIPANDEVIYTSPDVRKYNYHTFANISTNGHLHVEVTINGQLWHEVAVTLIDDITPNRISRAVPAEQIATFIGRFKGFRVRSFGGAKALGSHGIL